MLETFNSIKHPKIPKPIPHPRGDAQNTGIPGPREYDAVAGGNNKPTDAPVLGGVEGIIQLLTSSSEAAKNAGLKSCADNNQRWILERVSSMGIDRFLQQYYGKDIKRINFDSGTEYAFQLLLDYFVSDDLERFDLIIKSNFLARAITNDNPYNLSSSLRRSLAIYYFDTATMNDRQIRSFVVESNIFDEDEKTTVTNGQFLPS